MFPQNIQYLLFSPTMPKNILKLSYYILTNPTQVSVNPVSSTAETIQQYLYTTNKDTKTDLLLHLLANSDLDQVLLFARTKHGSDRIVRNLGKNNIKAAAIHGNKNKNKSQRAYQKLKEG